MKLPTPFGLFFIFVVVVLAAPFIPSGPLLLLDHLVVRIALLAMLLYVTRMGAIPSLFCFMAIAALFLERNRRKVQLAQQALDKMQAMDPNVTQDAPIRDSFIAPSTVHPVEFDRPVARETEFLPIREMDTAAFEPVAESINEKVVMASGYHGGIASVPDRFQDF